jgi:hypothetical protein
LREFVQEHTLVELELKVGVSARLYKCMDTGNSTQCLAKRPAADDRRQLVWRDRLAWIGAPPPTSVAKANFRDLEFC